MKEQDAGVKWFNTVFYPQRKTCRAARYEDGVLPRLREKKIWLFTPWGPRYSWKKRGTVIQEGDKEVEALRYLAELQRNMQGKNFHWMFLGADTYGTRINGLPDEVVRDYFNSFRWWLEKKIPSAEFHLWSFFNEYAIHYEGKVSEHPLDYYISYGTLSRAQKTSRAIAESAEDPDETNQRALSYLIERLAEAMCFERELRPIKISCVARNKDDEVDWELPRLYFLPKCLQAPWL